MTIQNENSVIFANSFTKPKWAIIGIISKTLWKYISICRAARRWIFSHFANIDVPFGDLRMPMGRLFGPIKSRGTRSAGRPAVRPLPKAYIRVEIFKHGKLTTRNPHISTWVDLHGAPNQ